MHAAATRPARYPAFPWQWLARTPQAHKHTQASSASRAPGRCCHAIDGRSTAANKDGLYCILTDPPQAAAGELEWEWEVMDARSRLPPYMGQTPGLCAGIGCWCTVLLTGL